jgi:hypothetical protein
MIEEIEREVVACLAASFQPSGKLRNLAEPSMKLVSSVLLLGLMSTPAAADPTVAKYLKDYDAANPDRRAILELIVSSIENGIGWSNSYAMVAQKRAPIYCLPGNLALTGGQITDMLRRRVEDHPKVGDDELGLAILMTVEATFPCK